MTSHDPEERADRSSQELPVGYNPGSEKSGVRDAERHVHRENGSAGTSIRIRTQMDHRNGQIHEALPAIPQARKLSVAVDAVALITTECITVTSAMRKHARWQHSSVSAILGGNPSFTRSTETLRPPRSRREKPDVQQEKSVVKDDLSPSTYLSASRWGLRGKKGRSMQDDPLLAAFARLRNDLRGCTGILHNAVRHYVSADKDQTSERSIFQLYYIPSFKSSDPLQPLRPLPPWH